MRVTKFVVVAFSALDALLALVIGLAIPLIPLTVMWVTRLDSGLAWDVYWRASADIWLFGHGVDMLITLDPLLAGSLGVAGAEAPFELTLAPLGFALITLLLGVRLGRRAVEAGTAYIGPTAAIGTFTALAILVALSARHASVTPSLWKSFVLPSAIFALGVVIGARGEIGRSGGRAEKLHQALTSWAAGLPAEVRALWRLGTYGGGIAVAALISVSALVFAGLLLANFTTIIGLYEGLQGGVIGSLAVTAVQLFYMPVLIVWVGCWFVGPGFALGTGSAVTPLGSALGPVPSLPVLGALPPAHLAFGFMGLVVPIVIGFLVGYAVRAHPAFAFDFATHTRRRWLRIWTPIVIATCGGLIVGLLSWAASGSAGPGRLVDVGPSPFLVAGVFALELLVGTALGMGAPRPPRRSR